MWPGARPLVLFLVTAAGCRCPDDRQGVSRGEQREEARRLAKASTALERRLGGLELVRRVLLWYSLTGREPGRMRDLLPGMVDQVTFGDLFALRRLENSPETDRRGRRRLRRLRNHLAGLVLERRAGALLDRWLPVLNETVRIPGGERPVRGGDLLAMVTGEPRWDRRQEIQARRIPLQRRLDALLASWHRRLRREAKRLDVSCFDLAEEREERDTRDLLLAAETENRRQGDRFRRALHKLIAPAAPAGRRATLADMRFVLQGGTHQPSLNERLLIPALERALRGLGLELRDGKGRPMPVSPTGMVTTALAVDPPDDERIAFHPASGLQDHIRLFEAGGLAACLAATRERSWVLRRLGPRLGARTMGHLLGLLWLEPGWWTVYRELKGDGAPSEEQVGDLLRSAVFAGLVRLRLGAVIAPILRAVLRGGPARTYEGVCREETGGSTSRLFGRLVRPRLGLELSPDEELGYLDELSPLEQPFDLRAYALAHQLWRSLRRRHGPRWFEDRDLGERLVTALCGGGATGSPEELAERAGLKRLDLTAPWRSLGESLDRLERTR